jgi:hypothetical protein
MQAALVVALFDDPAREVAQNFVFEVVLELRPVEGGLVWW